MEQQLTKQVRLQRSIERTIENAKKVGKGNLTPAKLRSRINSLKDSWAQYQEGHDLLSRAVPSTTKASLDYFKDGHYDATEDAFTAASDFLADLLEELEPFVSPNQSFSNATTRPEASSFSLAHLPPIRLPPFDGTFDEWEQFRNRFTALIRNNKDLTDFARMHYLVSCLRGRALECVANLPVTSDNFEIAWQAMTSRLEDRQRSLNAHLSTILTLNTVTRESSVELQTLLDKVTIAVASLTSLNRSPEQLWNDVLVHSVVSKLDSITRKAWNIRSSEADSPPSFDELSRFLHSRARALEANVPAGPSKVSTKAFPTSKVHVATTAPNESSTCPLCKAPHFINVCSIYLSKSPSARRDLVKQHNCCFNCLSQKHSAKDCPSRYSCRLCQGKHHSTLHISSDSFSDSATRASNRSHSQLVDSKPEINSLFASTRTPAQSRVLLATALITVSSSFGRSVVVRALIDQGSEMTFISETLAQMLRVKRIHMPISVSVVGGNHAGIIKRAANISVSPRDSVVPSIPVTALILNSITSYTPSQATSASSLSHLTNLKWSDPTPLSQEPIHILIGADLYHNIILDGVRKGEAGQPFAQNSIFGWIISGLVSSRVNNIPTSSEKSASKHAPPNVSTHHVLNSLALDEEIRRFWETEDLPRKDFLSPQDQKCEEHFRSTHSRAPCGRYIVRLPFKTGPPINIGDTRISAERSFAAMTRKFSKNSELASEYSEFIAEYIRLGHMRESSLPPSSSEQCVFIPHHAVIRDHSLTSHLRVVFNASNRSSNGSSLNDYLLVGSKLQTNLSSVISKWRNYKFVYSADIAKMYRQIQIDPRDINYQIIVWRASPSVPIREYHLLTVTYGMACAPFLALRVLKQLVEDKGADFPLAIPILCNNIYVDDLLFGADDANSLTQNRDQLVALLRRGGFQLRKWSSNSSALLADIDPTDHGLACSRILSIDDRVNILGVTWTSASDTLEFQVYTLTEIPRTKRSILSTIAKLYDPLGLVTPVTITAKIFMQELWRLTVGWDDTLPESMFEKWRKFYAKLQVLSELTIKRWTGFTNDAIQVELHGFADASASAYAAVVYLKVTNSKQSIITLLTGKSKVAPLTALNIPRLELNAAFLLVRLLEFVRESLDLASFPCYCWTDSTVVLAWIQQHPSHWKQFVANRVHEIQSRIPDAQWMHVSSNDNPADCASRGCSGDEIINMTLWWNGQSWLMKPQASWPTQKSLTSTDVSLEQRTVSLQCSPSAIPWDLASRYSSWPKLLRVTAYLFKFTDLCRQLNKTHPSEGFPRAALTPDECCRARTFWLKQIQTDVFPLEIQALSRNQSIPAKSSLTPLQPMLDHHGLMRVGGRLTNSTLSFSARHPIFLASHPLVTLLVKQAHLRTLHAGIQLTLSVIRQDFWILRARNITKTVIHRCVTCVRERAQIPTQLMGNLPQPRVSVLSRTFQHCGVDYAGPIYIRNSAGRGVKSHKAYISLFVCLATKAIHLELVSDCSTPAFVNAFSRFCTRRGLPQAMYSDNGTTFTGTDRELSKAYHAALRDPAFLNSTASDKIEWNFIPPSAPHFGGLWEAGVKSVKHHLRRVTGTHTLTIEEFVTLLCKIEACLNSRPLAPLSDTLNEYECLTPAHFLIGSAPLAPPEPSLLMLNENRLSRWQLVQQLTKRFWRIWQSDYLNTLQQRAKWRKVKPSITVGQLVLLRNSTLPPCKWELARVTACHPGTDGLVRVVSIKTAVSEYRRPITTLCVLPINDELNPSTIQQCL